MDLFGNMDLGEPDVEELLHGESHAVLHRRIISSGDSEQLFNELLDLVPWEQREITVYGKTHPQPRLVSWFGDTGMAYTYAGLTLQPRAWIWPILEIKKHCEALSGTRFNSVLLNLYRDGDDTVGWHSDDEAELGMDPIIASVSLGATRRFDLRNKASGETVKVMLTSGSVLLMSGRTQAEWAHQLPRTKKVADPRINLTFRRIYA